MHIMCTPTNAHIHMHSPMTHQSACLTLLSLTAHREGCDRHRHTALQLVIKRERYERDTNGHNRMEKFLVVYAVIMQSVLIFQSQMF